MNPHVHAFCTLAAENARRDAAIIDKCLRKGEAAGPLAGVPIAIKDLIATRHLRTTFGSPLYAEFVPDEDDVVVERLRQPAASIPAGFTEDGRPVGLPWDAGLMMRVCSQLAPRSRRCSPGPGSCRPSSRRPEIPAHDPEGNRRIAIQAAFLGGRAGYDGNP